MCDGKSTPLVEALTLPSEKLLKSYAVVNGIDTNLSYDVLYLSKNDIVVPSPLNLHPS